MKRLLMAAIVAAVTSSPVLAVDVWQGDLFLTKVTPACEPLGWTQFFFVRAEFLPADVGNNGANSVLSLFSAWNAQRYQFTGAALNGNGNYSGVFLTSKTAFLSWTGTFAKAKVKPSPAVGTPALVVQATINTFADIQNCTVTLEGALGSRPDL